MSDIETTLSGKYKNATTGTVYTRVTERNGIYTVTNEAGSQYFVKRDKLVPIPNRTPLMPSNDVHSEETSEFAYIDGTDVKKPTIEFLIDEICPHSPLLDFNKQRLLKLIRNKLREARIDELQNLPMTARGIQWGGRMHNVVMDFAIERRIAALTSEDNK